MPLINKLTLNTNASIVILLIAKILCFVPTVERTRTGNYLNIDVNFATIQLTLIQSIAQYVEKTGKENTKTEFFNIIHQLNTPSNPAIFSNYVTFIASHNIWSKL